MFPSLRPLLRLGQTIADWPVASQQLSRRNAMVALSACSRRREEREDVASYLALRAAQRATSAVPSSAPAAAAHA